MDGIGVGRAVLSFPSVYQAPLQTPPYVTVCGESTHFHLFLEKSTLFPESGWRLFSPQAVRNCQR
jgi:hypothetical protein